MGLFVEPTYKIPTPLEYRGYLLKKLEEEDTRYMTIIPWGLNLDISGVLGQHTHTHIPQAHPECKSHTRHLIHPGIIVRD